MTGGRGPVTGLEALRRWAALTRQSFKVAWHGFRGDWTEAEVVTNVNRLDQLLRYFYEDVERDRSGPAAPG